jgi:hypothetical protein
VPFDWAVSFSRLSGAEADFRSAERGCAAIEGPVWFRADAAAFFVVEFMEVMVFVRWWIRALRGWSLVSCCGRLVLGWHKFGFFSGAKRP